MPRLHVRYRAALLRMRLAPVFFGLLLGACAGSAPEPVRPSPPPPVNLPAADLPAPNPPVAKPEPPSCKDAPDECLRLAEQDLTRGDRAAARGHFLQACYFNHDVCLSTGDRLAPLDLDTAVGLYDTACSAGSTTPNSVRACVAAGDGCVQLGNLAAAESFFSKACDPSKKGAPCDQLQRVRDAEKILIQPVRLDAKVVAQAESSWTIELASAASLASGSDAWLEEQVTAPPGATLSDTLGKHDGWLTFSATTVVEVAGPKVTLKKRATVPFVRLTRTATKETNDIPLGAVGARIHLVSQRMATISVAEIAAWWKRGGPLAPATPTTPREIAGTLKSRSGKAIVVHFEGSDLPPVGAKGSLSKYFESKPGEPSPLGVLGGLLGGTVSGWLTIAEVTVKSVSGSDVTAVIDTEKSDVVVNGKKVNQFTPGAKVTLTL